MQATSGPKEQEAQFLALEKESPPSTQRDKHRHKQLQTCLESPAWYSRSDRDP